MKSPAQQVRDISDGVSGVLRMKLKLLAVVKNAADAGLYSVKYQIDAKKDGYLDDVSNIHRIQRAMQALEDDGFLVEMDREVRYTEGGGLWSAHFIQISWG